MHRTTWLPEPPYATGYLVDPYTDTVRVEQPMTSEGFGPSGQLWSTPHDLARLGDVLARPSAGVLAPDTVEEMHRVQAMFDAEWTLAWGLGVALYRDGDRFASGHDGAMPGPRRAHGRPPPAIVRCRRRQLRCAQRPTGSGRRAARRRARAGGGARRAVAPRRRPTAGAGRRARPVVERGR